MSSSDAPLDFSLPGKTSKEDNLTAKRLYKRVLYKENSDLPLSRQRCAAIVTGPNSNGHFNGMGAAVAPVPIEPLAGSRCSAR